MDVVVRTSTISTAVGTGQAGAEASRMRSTLAGKEAPTPPVGATTTAMPSDSRWARFMRRLRLEGLSDRSLFVFSEHNFVRKYAKIIIEWGYPLYASAA